jgi:hypothetical protein
MTRPARRRELAAIREQQDREREAEAFRKASLSLHSRIDELSVDDEVKAVLLIIAEKAGIDVWEDSE